MQSPVQRKSYGSVTVFWLDSDAVLEAIRVLSERLGDERNEVAEVVLFGSFSNGTATAGSDVDLLIVLERTDLPLLDRSAAYLPYFTEIQLPVDLFVYSQEEVRLRPSSIAEKALSRGTTMWKRR